jgi:hypothetical protein
MDAKAVLAHYDAEIRADPPRETGVERAWVDGVLRTEGAYNLIDWWDFPAEAALAVVAREAAHFAGREIEWKLFSHDGPPGLEAVLAAPPASPRTSPRPSSSSTSRPTPHRSIRRLASRCARWQTPPAPPTWPPSATRRSAGPSPGGWTRS